MRRSRVVPRRVAFWVVAAVLGACGSGSGQQGCNGSTNGGNGSLVFTGGPTPPNPSARAPFLIQVQALLPDGGVDTSFNAPVTLGIDNNPSSGVLSPPAPSVNAVSGVANFLGLSIDTAGSGYTLGAFSSNYGSAVSPAFNIVAVCQISPPSVPSSSPFALAAGTVGIAYPTQQLTASSPCGTVTWSSAPSPPAPGLTLDPATGAISGTPTQAGSSTFTVTANGSSGSASQAYSIAVSTGGSTLHAITGRVDGGVSTGVTLTASGGASTTTTSCRAGYILAGLADGMYTVTPSLAGYTFSPASLTVTVSGADVVGEDFTAIPGGCAFAPASKDGLILPPASVGVPYGPVSLVVNGCGNASFGVDGGVFPFGLNLASTGSSNFAQISGTPTAAADWNFTIKATGSSGSPATQLYTLSTTQGCAIRPAFLGNGAVGNSYPLTTLQASNGCGTGLSWGVDGGTLPPGLKLYANGDLNGTPTTPGSYSFAISVNGAFDGGTASATQPYFLNIAAQCALDPPGVPGMGLYELFPALQAEPYLQNFTPTLGCGGAFFDVQLVSGQPFPPGLQYNLGAVQGTPTGSGTSDFVLSICGSTGVGSQQYEVRALNPPGCVMSPGVDPNTLGPSASFALPDGHVNNVYNVALRPSQPCGTYGSGAFTVTSGGLPSGLSISGDGVIRGTLNGPVGVSTFSINLASTSGGTTQQYTINVVTP